MSGDLIGNHGLAIEREHSVPKLRSLRNQRSENPPLIPNYVWKQVFKKISIEVDISRLQTIEWDDQRLSSTSPQTWVIRSVRV